ncbi:unnamed protein product, partial [Protopolystoma xenopodis]
MISPLDSASPTAYSTPLSTYQTPSTTPPANLTPLLPCPPVSSTALHLEPSTWSSDHPMLVSSSLQPASTSNREAEQTSNRSGAEGGCAPLEGLVQSSDLNRT